MSTQQLTVAATGDEALLVLAKRFASVYASYQGAEEVFAPDAVFDVNVPNGGLGCPYARPPDG